MPVHCNTMLASSFPFVGVWRSNMHLRTLLAGTEGRKIGSSLVETERAIRSATYDGRIVVVLSIVLPKANRAQLQSTTLTESEEVTARAWKSTARFRCLDHRVVV